MTTPKDHESVVSEKLTEENRMLLGIYAPNWAVHSSNAATLNRLLDAARAEGRAEAEPLRAIIRDGLAVIDSPQFQALAERNAGALLLYSGPRLDVEAARKALGTGQ